MADTVLDIAAPDSAGATVEATPDATTVETPTAESTTPETDSTTTEPAAEGETKEPTKEGTEKPADANAAAVVTPKAINEHLQQIKKDRPELAKAMHQSISDGLRMKAFLKELDVMSLDQAKEKLSTNPEIEAFTESVRNADEKLYRGNLSELSTDVLADLESELGTKEAASQRFAQFAEAAFETLKTANRTEHVNLTRGILIDSLYTSGFPQAVNTLSQALKSNDVASAKQVVSEIVKWFTDEQKTDDQRREQTKVALDTAKNEATTQSSLRTAVEKDTNYASNRILGGYFADFMRTPFGKTLARPELESLAVGIRAELKERLAQDKAYQSAWRGTMLDKTKLLARHEKAVSAVAKDIVNKIVTARYPKETAKPTPVVKPVAKPTALPTVDVKLDGKSVKAVLLYKRPKNRLLDDVNYNGRTYRRSEIEMLQMGKGQGFVKGKLGNPVLVTWRGQS